MILPIVLLPVVQAVLERNPDLTDGTHTDIALGVITALALAQAPAPAPALAVMLAVPWIGYWALLLLLTLTDRAARLWHRFRSEPEKQSQA